MDYERKWKRKESVEVANENEEKVDWESEQSDNIETVEWKNRGRKRSDKIELEIGEEISESRNENKESGIWGKVRKWR